jgi:DHA1 family multidrug resistance protein-like MFS transporter
MGDIFPPKAQPYAIGIWSLGAVSGPVFGPVIGGFAAEANGWAWPTLELLWISGFAFIVLSISLPETLGSTVLQRRAERLRKLTGNMLLKTQDELDHKEGSTVLSEVSHNFIRAFQLCAEPAIAFANAYIALVYAIFYLWFEAFPLVFSEIYGFSLGLGGLPFLGFIVTGIITVSPLPLSPPSPSH